MRSRIKIAGLWFERYTTKGHDFVNYLGGRVLKADIIARPLVEWEHPIFRKVGNKEDKT